MTLGEPAFVGFPFLRQDDPPPVPKVGLALWLDALYGVATDGATTRVTGWSSRVGGLVAQQTTTAQMPVTSSMNRLPSVAFDGADDWMAIAGAPTIPDASTIFVVSRVASVDVYKTLLGGASGAYELNVKNSGGVRVLAGGGADLITTLSGKVEGGVDTLETVSYVRSGAGAASGAIRVNRQPIETYPASGTVTPFSAPANRLGMGTGDRMAGLISEVLVYVRLLSDPEIATVERYLAAKWGTA